MNPRLHWLSIVCRAASQGVLKNAVFGLVENIGEQYRHAGIQQPHRGGGCRRIAQIGAANVAGLVASLLRHRAAAEPVDDVDFVVIRNGALAYHDPLAVF